jgi:hypothetical protein
MTSLESLLLFALRLRYVSLNLVFDKKIPKTMTPRYQIFHKRMSREDEIKADIAKGGHEALAGNRKENHES